MSLLTAIERETGATATQCKTCTWLTTLDGDDEQAFTKAVASVKAGTMQASALWRACTHEGLKVASSSFNRHLRECETL